MFKIICKMKKYNSVQFQIIVMASNVIATSQVGLGSDTSDENMISAPERYGRGRYDAEYDLY